ncbi:hypothetical protein BBO99_00000195 [Phytophthora kernoviae]|uniref:Kinesin motor domain-containing protein n=1 Tax=Phytophthora kernoviae TaxID=325452 RepID=A0A421ET78_9STRA|nr:hypothetical protein BBI17_000297 [Phytophthora kernoviae]RLN85794.1 hypothetical protein BBO99_00000195 [Phytophthora kernoviae]
MTKVYLRPRPLADSEQGDEVVEYVVEDRGIRVVNASKHFKNFTGILSMTNSEAYTQAISPLVPAMLAGSTSCCFAYGHTNSGKTHTIFGYGDELGMCQRLLQDLFEQSDGGLLMQVRFYELYNSKVFDLLNNRQPGFVRQDGDGTIHVRSTTTMGPNGEVLTQSLHAGYADSANAVIDIIRKGKSIRAEGTSELHHQSSRSHAVLELEIVTPALAQSRQEVALAQARVVPLGKARDDLYIAIQSQLYTFVNGKHTLSGVQPTQEDQDNLNKLQAQVDTAEAEVTAKKERVIAEKAKYPGGMFVLVDLAGAEYMGEGLARTPQERKEAREINSSLLALKECIRAQSQDHVAATTLSAWVLAEEDLAVVEQSFLLRRTEVTEHNAHRPEEKQIAALDITVHDTVGLQMTNAKCDLHENPAYILFVSRCEVASVQMLLEVSVICMFKYEHKNLSIC